MKSSQTETVVEFTVPLGVPSVNHYKVPAVFKGRNGYLRRGFTVSPEAKAFKDAVAIFARGRTVAPETEAECRKVRYTVEATLYYGPRMRLDVDNCGKVLLDSIQAAGLIHSDAFVQEFKVVAVKNEREDPRNPRTNIIVRRLD